MALFSRVLYLFPKAVSGKPIIALKMSQTTVHPIAESGYSTSQLYDRARPSYSKEAVTFLLEKLSILPRKSSSNPSMRVLELGTGTGKFTCVLQDVLRGNNVEIIASEPLLSMRQEFKKNCPHIEVKDFAAENIDLPNSSVHAVIAAQCFHWFANNKSISQIHRILVPGSKLGLVWNSWDHSMPWVRQLNEEVILPLYWETNTPVDRTYEWKKVLESSEKFGPIDGDESQFKLEQELTFDGLMDRVMSVSVVQSKNENEKVQLKEKIEEIWNRHNKAEKKKLILPHVVKIFWAEKKMR